MLVVLASPAAASRTIDADPAPQSPLSPAFLSSLISSTPIGAPSITPDGRILGERPGPQDLVDARATLVPEARERGPLPATYDLRTLGRVTSVKDQRPHGTCWAFASCGSLESCLLPGETRDFSEDNMVLASGFDDGGDAYERGGNIYMSSAYLVRWGGPVDEADDAYGDGYTPPGLTPRKHVQEVVWIPSRGSALDNENVKNAVMQYGAVYVAMGWFGSSGGSSYYNAATASYYYDDGFLTNHGVLIVGWDDGYAAANFATTPPGDGAFIVKNSWGTGWGDAWLLPRLLLRRGVRPHQPHGGVLQRGTDRRLHRRLSVRSLGLRRAVWVFPAQPGGSPTSSPPSRAPRLALSVSTPRPRGAATRSTRDPALATKTLATSGTLPYMGYHTVTLPSSVSVTAGQSFVDGGEAHVAGNDVLRSPSSTR